MQKKSLLKKFLFLLSWFRRCFFFLLLLEISNPIYSSKLSIAIEDRYAYVERESKVSVGKIIFARRGWAKSERDTLKTWYDTCFFFSFSYHESFVHNNFSDRSQNRNYRNQILETRFSYVVTQNNRANLLFQSKFIVHPGYYAPLENNRNPRLLNQDFFHRTFYSQILIKFFFRAQVVVIIILSPHEI